MRFAVPTGLAVALTMMLDYYLVHRHGMTLAVAGTSVSFVTMLAMITVLVILSRPFNWWKAVIVVVSGAGFLAIISSPLRESFRYQIDPRSLSTTIWVGILGVFAVLVVYYLNRRFTRKD